MLLHTVNKSPAQSALLEDCLEHAVADTAIVLIEDGVLAALDTEMNRDLFEGLSSELYALEADVLARGLADRLLPAVTVIDYAAFVELCVRCDKVVNWN